MEISLTSIYKEIKKYLSLYSCCCLNPKECRYYDNSLDPLYHCVKDIGSGVCQIELYSLKLKAKLIEEIDNYFETYDLMIKNSDFYFNKLAKKFLEHHSYRKSIQKLSKQDLILLIIEYAFEYTDFDPDKSSDIVGFFTRFSNAVVKLLKGPKLSNFY